MASFIVMMIWIPIDRRRARKSAEGPWYDKPGLTAEHFPGKER